MSKSKNILITGASRGIGLLASKTLAQSGHYIVAAMRDLEGRNAVAAQALNAWAKEHDYGLETIEMDVCDESSVNSAIKLVEKHRPIDVLINNAGVMPVGITEAYTPEQIKACFDVNVFGVARTCRAVLPYMRERQSGLLIHLSSTAGRQAIPFFGVYCASKWALEALVESMHYEIDSFGIESIIVEPGGHATDLINNPPAPADNDCIKSYGAIAEVPKNMINMFEAMFAAKEDITNAQNVADKICSLVNMDEAMPIRITVGNDMGLNRINESVAPIQAELIRMLQPVTGMKAEDKRLYLSAEISLKPECYEAGKAAIEGIIPLTLNEPGCHVFSLMEDQSKNGKLHLFEIFEDEHALQRHHDKDYTKAIFTQYEDWLEKPIEITKMQASSPETSLQFS